MIFASFFTYFVTLLIYFLTKEAHGAIQAPNFVFRADFRDPQTIFIEGFKSIGQNVNLLEHVQGTSCSYGPNPSTAFVATTSNESFAEKWGADQLWIDSTKGPQVYIYRIRATDRFYSAYDSLLDSYIRKNKQKYKSAADHYKYQQEWLAYNGISHELIVSVKVMGKAEPGKLKLINIEQNPRYQTIPSHGNPQPFHDPSKSASDKVSLLVSKLPYLGKCFGSRPGRKSDELYPNVNATPGVFPSKQFGFEASSTAEKATVWDQVNGETSERIVPWKEETVVRGHVFKKPTNCTILPGIGDQGYPVQITCPQNSFYDRFVVFLRAGTGAKTFVNTRFEDGVTGKFWTKLASDIPLLNGHGTLQDKNVSIAKAFCETTADIDSWWSFIKVYPVFPDYGRKQK